MKNLIYIFIIGIFLITSCEKPDEPKHVSSCDNGYIVNEDSTDCVCPKETHYELFDQFGDYNTSSCYEKTEYGYLCKFEGRDCYRNYSLNNGDTGYFRFSENNNLISISFPNGSGINRFEFFDIEKKLTDNSEVEINFKVWGSGDMGCPDWGSESSCSPGIKGYAHGISNPENTELDIRIEYKDCKDKIIDIGYLHLWKE